MTGPHPPLLDLAALVPTVRRMVAALHGAHIADVDGDVDDVTQDVMVRLLEAQRSERSRWDPRRGRSASSYAYGVAHSAGLNSLRTHRRWSRERVADKPFEVAVDVPEEDQSATMERLLALLDLDEERDMVLLLASGRSVPEAGRCMGISPTAATELATRVRALLLPLREG